ncbi:MAG TPA: aminotransferase class IV [Pseudomonadales bacterium]|jgi:branched-chain amino acid aminotransferase
MNSSASDRVIWRNGEFVPWADATVHVLAQSLQRGTLAFDFMSVHETADGPAIFRLEAHIERLLQSCRLEELPILYPAEALMEACAETVRRNPGCKSVKISALIASIEVELIPQDPAVAVFIAAYDSARDIMAKHQTPYPTRETLALKVEREISNRRHDILPPQAKVAANYTSPTIAKRKARAEGFDDVLLLTERGTVAEAPTSNIFVVRDGGLATPPENDVLLGITRASIIEIAGFLNLPCEEQELELTQLYAANEAFLTNTSTGVWPIERVDDVVFGDGAPGPVTKRLRAALRKISSGEEPTFRHWLHYV